ncbi:MAG: serine hydrolase [Verrucomicrobia bacterium]|nr:serine hydrolase [Verrucomicrobiota bacterium]
MKLPLLPALLVALVLSQAAPQPLRSAESAVAAVAPAAVDAIFATWDKPSSPGCALAVIHDGRIIYERGYGSADLEHDLPISPATVFYVGSDSKQFTAAAIALLAQRGVLSLDDDVRSIVPELPDYGGRLTVRHLVHHTSGLRDYLELRALAGEPTDAPFNDEDVLGIITRQKELNFAPGSQHLYSNSGYFLLSVIVKRKTGKSLRDFAAENFFGPLGMTTAQFRDDHTALVPHRAQGYVGRTGAYRLSNPNFDAVGAGGVFMTVRDFLPWDQNFYDAKIGGREFLDLIQTPGKLNDGSALTYAFGLTVTRYQGLKIVEHGGAYGGFRAHLLRFPEQHFSVACFANLGSMEPGKLARAVADLYLAGPMREARLAAPRDGAKSPSPAPAAKNPPATAAATPPAPASLADYEGDFFSAELQSVFHVGVANGRLTVRGGRRAAAPLTAARTDVFTAPGWELIFQRGAEGRVDAFTLNAGRVKHLRFTKR